MPRRRKKTTKYKRRRRRTYRRRMRRKRRPRRISDTIFPPTQVVKMKYQTLLTLDPPSAGTIAYHRYNLSSVFDPDYDSVITDSSCRTFDQSMAAYQRYLVLGCRISVRPFGPEIRNSSSAPAAAYGVMVFPRDNSSFLSGKNWNDLEETRVAAPSKRAWVNFYNPNNRSLNLNYSQKKHFQTSAIALKADEAFSGDAATSPGSAHTGLAGVWLCSPGAAADISPLTFNVRIEYIVQLYSPKFVAASF